MQMSGATAMPLADQSAITPQPRLVKAAHEFEAQMMKELLKPMTTSSGLTGDEDDSDAGSNGALGEFAAESLGRALSEQGGLGIARSILRNFSHSGNNSQPAQVMTKPHGNSGINKPE